jgi:hypothetical membrane protein
MSTITSTAAGAFRADRRRDPRRLLVFGVLSSLVYVAADLLAGWHWPGYSFTAQTISELSAIDAPSRAVWKLLGILYDLLLIGFGVGVWRVAAGPGRLRTAAALVIAIGLIGLVWPPMHMRGTVTTLTDTLHVVFAGLVAALILVAVGLGARAGGPWFRRYSFWTLAVLVGSGLVTAMYSDELAANAPTPALGILERINVGAYLVWVVALSIVLARRTRRAEPAA